MSRRDLFRMSGLAAAAVGGAQLLSACGGDGRTAGGGGGGTGGVLVHGATGGGADDTLDAHRPVSAPDIARVSNLFEPLLFWDADYRIAPALAESVEPSDDATQWTIRLREGVTFHNGKDLTPEDVLFTINRVAGSEPTSAGVALAPIIDLDGTRKIDDRTLVIALQTPYAVLDYLLAEYTFGIVPVDYDPATPVGTGAFQYQSFQPGQNSVFQRYNDYWGDAALLDELRIQNFNDENAAVNALLAGQIQTVDNLPYNLVDSVTSQGGQAIESNTGAWVPFTMRVDAAPFSDNRVRQAMRLIVDRQQMIDNALSGYGTLGNDLYAPFDVAYNDGLPQREQDIDQARSLLRQAGQEGLQVELNTGPGIGGNVGLASANLFVEQAKQAGVDVRLNRRSEFYGDQYLSYPFAQDFWNTRNYLPQAAVGVLAGGTYNETHFDKADVYPQFAELIASAQAETDEARRTTLLQDAQEIEHENGGLIIWGFRRNVDGVASSVSGIEPNRYLPLNSYKFQTASVSA